MSRLTRVPGILYGGDYNPEQWPEDVWAEDAALMREAGVTMMTVGVFSWARFQPGPDSWDFGWFDRLLDLLHAHGIAVDLATATASPPAWLVRAHPEILPVTADGVRLEFGSRQHYCPPRPTTAPPRSASPAPSPHATHTTRRSPCGTSTTSTATTSPSASAPAPPTTSAPGSPTATAP